MIMMKTMLQTKDRHIIYNLLVFHCACCFAHRNTHGARLFGGERSIHYEYEGDRGIHHASFDQNGEVRSYTLVTQDCTHIYNTFPLPRLSSIYLPLLRALNVRSKNEDQFSDANCLVKDQIRRYCVGQI